MQGRRKNLKKSRTEKGLSLEKLSADAGPSKTQIGNIEQGRTNYTIDTLIILNIPLVN